MRIYLWYPILASLAMGFAFMNIPPLSRQFMVQLGVDYDGLSWLLSGLFVTHALMQVPAGLLADRLNPWRVLVAGLGLCVVANVLPFLAPQSIIWATGMRIVLGFGTGLAFIALMKIMIVLIPSSKLTFIQGLQGAGFSVGFVLPYLILPLLGDGAWPWAYLMTAALLLLVFGLAFCLPHHHLKSVAQPRSISEVGQALKNIASSKIIWVLGIFHGLSYGSLNNLGNWLPSILADLDGIGEPLAWTSLTAMILMIGALGRAFGGKIMPRLSRDRAVNRAVLMICLLYLVMGVTGQQYMVLGAAILMALACGSTYGGIFTLSAAAGAAYAATGMGMMNMIGNMVNVLITLAFGYVRQYTGDFSPGFLAGGLLGLGFWFWGRKMVSRASCSVS